MAKKRSVKTRVRVWCADRDMTQGELAKKLGMSSGRLSMILSGQVKPTLDQFAAFESVVGLRVADFVSPERVA